jgi:hypothetical protein
METSNRQLALTVDQLKALYEYTDTRRWNSNKTTSRISEGDLMPLILGTNSIKDTGYDVANSLRFNDDSQDFLNRTLGTPTNNKKWTYSAWLKKSSQTDMIMFSCGANNNDRGLIYFNNTGDLNIYGATSGSGTYFLATNRLFRDNSAWYHIVISYDSTQATSTNRIKIYVNGIQETSLSQTTYPAENHNSYFNSAIRHDISGRMPISSDYLYNGYMSEVVFIDGSQLDPTSFGEFDSDSPTIWKPKDVSGLTFGNNGFYLDFENSGSLGADVSGNGNNFTVNNLTSVDQSTDTCTNNFATMNPLSAGVGDTNRIPTFAEGNLKFTASSSTFCQAISTFGVDQGKWYYEVKVVSSTHLDKLRVGLWNIDKNVSSGEIQDVSSANSGVFYMNKDGGEMRLNATSTTNDYGTFAQNDIIGVTNDIDNRTISIYKNGSVIVNAYDYSGGIASGTVLTPAFMGHTNTSFEINFGSPSFSISSGNSDANGYGNFEYAVPSGYYALNSKNLAEFG